MTFKYFILTNFAWYISNLIVVNVRIDSSYKLQFIKTLT